MQDGLDVVADAQAATARLKRRQLARAAAEAAGASPDGPPDGIVAVKVQHPGQPAQAAL